LATNKILEKILRGTSDANIPFEGLRRVLRNLGFGERIKGSHHIFFKPGIDEILNLQPKGNKAKPYQVKQVRHVILKYRLGDAPDVETEV
jgi:predicted RNA binding protein YcfA (HicA-like mRNA interferase family)